MIDPMSITPPDPDRGRAAAAAQRLRAVTVGEPVRLDGPVVLSESSAQWPVWFDQEAERIRAALGEIAIAIEVEHVGSTSVPGLAAKPILDIDLAVQDSAAEETYVPALEAIGYQLRIREPDWFEHRLLRFAEPAVNLHVFSAGCEEITRNLLLRNWLRANAADRDLYESTKRELAARRWAYVQQYADAKSAVITEILARAAAAGFTDDRRPRV